MPRTELNTGHLSIDQMPPIAGASREPDIVLVERVEDNDYLEALAFNEDPVTIRIEPGIEENAPRFHPVTVNGRGAEVLVNGKWLQYNFLPVGEKLTTKRKYLEVLLRSKRTNIRTSVIEAPGRDPDNQVLRPTAATMSISIIHDPSPRGAAWVTELYRRYF